MLILRSTSNEIVLDTFSTFDIKEPQDLSPTISYHHFMSYFIVIMDFCKQYHIFIVLYI